MRERAALLHALRHWQPYLIGKEFTLRTDHNPNLALAKGKMKSYDTLTYEILEFMPFKMEFLNGNKMFVGALSRQSPSPPPVCAINQSMTPPLLAQQSTQRPVLSLHLPALTKQVDVSLVCFSRRSFPILVRQNV